MFRLRSLNVLHSIFGRTSWSTWVSPCLKACFLLLLIIRFILLLWQVDEFQGLFLLSDKEKSVAGRAPLDQVAFAQACRFVWGYVSIPSCSLLILTYLQSGNSRLWWRVAPNTLIGWVNVRHTLLPWLLRLRNTIVFNLTIDVIWFCTGYHWKFNGHALGWSGICPSEW